MDKLLHEAGSLNFETEIGHNDGGSATYRHGIKIIIGMKCQWQFN